MSSSRNVDVIVVNYRGASEAIAAIETLMPWDFGTLWLVDNSEDGAEADTLAQHTGHLPWVRLLVAERNLGFGRGCNLAFARSEAPYCLLLNPDAQIVPADLQLLVETLQADPRLAAVSPRTFWDRDRRFLLPLAFPQTPLVETGMAMASRSPKLCLAASRRYLGRMRQYMASSQPVETPFLSGALLMLRRKAVLDAGGLFDPGYFMFFEDTDLSLRLRQAGFRLAVVPTATAVHEYRHKPLKAPLMAETRGIFFQKQHPFFYRWTRQMRLLERFRRPLRWEEWGDCVDSPTVSPVELEAHLDGAGILAWSPLPMMMPAIFRPLGAPAVPFSDADWQELEPGRYMLALRHAAAPGKLRYLSFVRAAANG